MDLWSVNELFQLGPLSSQSESAGKDSYQGQGIRELIYAWPLSARCRVEEQVASRGYTKGMGNVLVAGRGLFALDYLLFYSGSDTACSGTSTTGKAWPGLSEGDVVRGKLDYAAAVGHDIVQQMAVLRAAWSPDGGNFRPRFVDATGYPNEQEAMKVLGWALIYVEHEVKDWKLGLPAGHAASAPVSEAEGAYSDLGTRAIRANLRGFRSLFQGCGAEGEGLGFDDWLSEAGHPELARDIVAAWQTAQAFADGAPPLSQATPAELEAFYQAVKALTDLLKNDLFGAGSPLGLTLPKGVEGDTD
jgi:predicted lipoprotein